MEINETGELIVYFTDGTTQNLGKIIVNAGEQKDDEILLYTLLDDGTYEVRSGPGAKGLEEILIPSKHNDIAVTRIANNGFTNNAYLTTVSLPNTITEIGEEAFLNCINLSEIQLPKNILRIEQSAFSNSGISSITIPESCVFLGAKAFYQSNLSNITFEDDRKYNTVATKTSSSYSEKGWHVLGENCLGVKYSQQVDGFNHVAYHIPYEKQLVSCLKEGSVTQRVISSTGTFLGASTSYKDIIVDIGLKDLVCTK